MALLLACWRWLMPPTAGMASPSWLPVAVPLAPVPAAARPSLRLAPIHAPPLRLPT